MYIFYGKLNLSSDTRLPFTHRKYAYDEPFVLLFPADLAYYDPVCAYWQWTKDGNGTPKQNHWEQDFITSISRKSDKTLHLGFVFSGSYTVTAVVAEDSRTVEMTMRNADDNSISILREKFRSKSQIASCAVYTGKFNYQSYAENEMLTVVVPEGFETDKPVRVFFQWTKNDKGVLNDNNDIGMNFDKAYATSNGEVAISFTSDDRYYEWEGTVSTDKNKMELYSTPKNGSRVGPYKLEKSGWSLPSRRKVPAMTQSAFLTNIYSKALLARYDVGTDSGLFEVRDLLIDTLGFDSNCVEMLYYNLEPKVKGRRQPASCQDGQQAPTASRFKKSFETLIRDTKPGDVRFLYVDAHESPLDDPNSGEADKRDEGWKFASREDGVSAEAVHDDWLADTITTYLPLGVNLTILTSSCMGGGMLDVHKGTRGVLLAACHESQFNVKAYKGKDPWTVAINTLVKGHKKRNRAMPTYAQLYSDAKSWINRTGTTTLKYLGRSPDPTNPLPMRKHPTEKDSNISNQDPQLMYCEDYINVDVVRFLSPLSEWETNLGRPIRFPNDEL